MFWSKQSLQKGEGGEDQDAVWELRLLFEEIGSESNLDLF